MTIIAHSCHDCRFSKFGEGFFRQLDYCEWEFEVVIRNHKTPQWFEHKTMKIRKEYPYKDCPAWEEKEK